MRDQFKGLSSGEAKVTVTAVVNYINDIKDDNLTDNQVEELVKSKQKFDFRRRVQFLLHPRPLMFFTGF